MGTVSLKSEAASRSVCMLRTAMGPTITGWLEDPAIVEIMLNPDGRLWIDCLTGKLSDTGKRLSAEDGERIVRVVAHHVGAEVHPGSPRLSAELPETGIDAGLPILQAAGSLVGFTTIFTPTSWMELAVLYSAWLVVVARFFVLAIQLFVTLIEFKFTTLAGFVLVPFGLFGKTAFLAECVLGNIIASGVKILVLAVIVGISTNLFSQFTQLCPRARASHNKGEQAIPAGNWPRTRLDRGVSELRNIATLRERDAQCTKQVAAMLLFVIAFIIAAMPALRLQAILACGCLSCRLVQRGRK